MTAERATHDELRDLRDSADRLLARDDDPPGDRWRRMAGLGWFSLLVPPERDGAGAGVDVAVAVADALGRAGAREPFTAGAVLPAAWLTALPRTDAADTVLADIAGGSRVGVAWLPHDGAPDRGGVRLGSTPDGVALTGRVCWVAVPDAGVFLVLARSADGVAHLVRCPADLPGTAPLQLADGSRCTHLEFDRTPLPSDAVLHTGPDVESALAGAVDLALVLVAAELTGIARRALDLTCEHLRTRRQFDRPLGSFQSAAHAAVDMYTRVRLSAAAVAAAVAEWDRPDATDRDRAAAASSAKAAATAAARHVTTKAVHLHGALGFSDEYVLGRYVNRALVLAAFLGTERDHRRRHHALALPAPDEQFGRPADAVATSAGTPQAAPRFGVAQERDWNAMGDEEFRAVVRAEFEAHHPTAIRYPSRRLYWSEQREWFERMAATGWIAPNWPVEFGGMGLSASKLMIFIAEQERWGIARFQDQGIRMIGPMLFAHGTEAQRAMFLPGILSCEHRYCQGYSEPEAGSDLASLRTRARRDGDEYVVDGHKIWTTMAHDVTHIMVLARTDPDAPKHRGISFFLVPLDTPGITVRPIRDIAGHEELCEVFFDGVRVPAANRIGGEGEGWRVGNSVLAFERVHIGTPSMPAYALERLRRLTGEGDGADMLASLELDVRHLRDLYGEFAAVIRDGGTPGPDVSILKIVATELTRRIGDEIVEVAGPAGAVREPVDGVEALDVFYKALPSTIYGGSNDIQRDVVAKRVLGLPAGPGR